MAGCDGRELSKYPFITLYDPGADYQHIIKDSEPINEKTKRILIQNILGGWNSGNMNIVNNSLGDSVFLKATNSSGVLGSYLILDPNNQTAQVRGFRGTSLIISADTDNQDVSGFSVIEVDTSIGAITIGGFSNGVKNQTIFLYKTGTNNLTIEHLEPSGTQKFITSTGVDVLFPNDRGGMVLVFNDIFWRDCSY